MRERGAALSLAVVLAFALALPALAADDPAAPPDPRPAAPGDPAVQPPHADPSEEPLTPAQEELLRQFARWSDLLRALEGSDEEASARAFAELLKVGRPVILLVQERLRERKGLRLAELLAELMAAYPDARPAAAGSADPPAGAATDPTPAPPPAAPPALSFRLTPEEIEKARAPLQLDNLTEVDKFLAAKFLEANELAAKDRCDEAIRLCEAILALRPDTTLRPRIKAFKVECEDKLVQARLVRATFVPDRTLYELGDVINLKLVLENLTPDPMEITLVNTLPIKDKETDRRHPKLHLKGLIDVTVTLTEFNPVGDSGSLTRQDYHQVDSDITLLPGARWSTMFSIKTADDDPKNGLYRTYTVEGRVLSFLIKAGERSSARPIVIPPLTIPVYPVKVSRILDDPIQALGSALDNGSPNDLYLVCRLIPEVKRQMATELLMAALDVAAEPRKILILSCLRQVTRQPIPLEEPAWRKWWQAQQEGGGLQPPPTGDGADR